jgi:adenine-specific DNA glycosylase
LISQKPACLFKVFIELDNTKCPIINIMLNYTFQTTPHTLINKAKKKEKHFQFLLFILLSNQRLVIMKTLVDTFKLRATATALCRIYFLHAK